MEEKTDRLNYFWYVRHPKVHAVAGIDDLSKISSYSSVLSKTEQSVISTTPIRSEWEPTQYFFIDIDTKEGVDTIINGIDKLFHKCKYLRTMQPSFSGKLHFTAVNSCKCDSPTIWVQTYCYMLSSLLENIKQLFGIDYYNMKDENDKYVVDMHNAKWDQLLFVSKHDIYYSPYQDEYSEQIIYSSNFIRNADKLSKEEYDELPTQRKRYLDSIKYLEEHYSRFFKTCENEIKDAEIVKEMSDKISNANELLYPNISKIKVDRNYVIGNYRGNDIRWRISVIANLIDPEHAKEWCDKYFYYDGNKSIWQKLSSREDKNICNITILNHLERIGLVKQKKQSLDPSKFGIILNDTEYLSDRKDEILKFIDDNHICEIVSPTGTGKTTLIENVIAPHFKRIFVVTPMNSTNTLYKFKCVCSCCCVKENGMMETLEEREQRNLRYIFSKDSLVMNVNQFVKYFESIEGQNVPIIFDEAHTCFTEQTYRYEIMKDFIDCLKNYNGRIIMMTATQTIENQYIEADVLKIGKERTNVNINFKYLTYGMGNIINEEMNILKNKDYINNYDHICFFDNVNATNLEAYCNVQFGKDKFCVLRKREQESDDYKFVIDHEVLQKKIIICTCVAFQGLNFKNTDKILCVVPFVQDETFKQTIVQICGRFRIGETKALVLGQIKQNNMNFELTVTDKIQNICKQQGMLFCKPDELSDDYKLDMFKYQDYLHNNCGMLQTIDYLQENVDTNLKFNYVDYTSPKQYKNEEQKQIENSFIMDVKNGTFRSKEYTHWYEKELRDYLQDKIIDLKNLNIGLKLHDETIGYLLSIRPNSMKIKNCIDRIFDDYKNYKMTNVENMSYNLEKLREYLRNNVVSKKKGSSKLDIVVSRFFKYKEKELTEQYNLMVWLDLKSLEKNESEFEVNPELLFDVQFNDVDPGILENRKFNNDYREFYDKMWLERKNTQMKNIVETSKDVKQNAGKAGGLKGGKNGGKIGSPKKTVIFWENKKIYNSVSEMCGDLGHNISWASKNKHLWAKIE